MMIKKNRVLSLSKGQKSNVAPDWNELCSIQVSIMFYNIAIHLNPQGTSNLDPADFCLCVGLLY